MKKSHMDRTPDITLHPDGQEWLAHYHNNTAIDPIFLKDLELMTRGIQQADYHVDSQQNIEDEGLDGSITVNPEVVRSVSTQHGLDGDLIVIARLSGDKSLARTFPKDTDSCSHIVFLVFHNRTGEVILKFEWPVIYYMNNFGFSRPGGCIMQGLSSICFQCSVNQSRNLVTLVGPATSCVNGSENYSLGTVAYPSMKIIDVTRSQVKDIELYHGGVRVWPASLIFEDSFNDADAIMVCSDSSGFQNSCPANSTTLLARYSFSANKWLNVISEISFSTSFLLPIQTNRLLCASKESSIIQQMWIINSRTFEPVKIYDIPIDAMLEFDEMSFSPFQVNAAESVSSTELHVITWHSMPWGEQKLNVVSLALPPEHVCKTLQQLCRTTVLLHLRNCDRFTIHRLPLPKKLFSFLEGF